MASITGGVPLGGFISPTDSADTFPVTNPTYGLGSLRTVGSTADRNAIFDARREEGMIVYVQSNATYYGLIGGTANGDWVELYLDSPGGGGSTLGVSGPDGAVSTVSNLAFFQGQNVSINVSELNTGTAGITFSVSEIIGGTF